MVTYLGRYLVASVACAAAATCKQITPQITAICDGPACSATAKGQGRYSGGGGSSVLQDMHLSEGRGGGRGIKWKPAEQL